MKKYTELEKITKLKRQLALKNFSKINELEEKIIKLFPKINKNSRTYYLFNGLYTNISFEILMRYVE